MRIKSISLSRFISILSPVFLFFILCCNVGAECTVVRFAAAGDNIIHDSVRDDAGRRSTETRRYNFYDMYAPVAGLIDNADLALINCETPIAGSNFPYSGYPMFNTPPECGDALVETGFNVINIANNHMLDKGETGYANHMKYWRSRDVYLIGGCDNDNAADHITVAEKNGVRIAFLAYTYGTNDLLLPEDSPLFVPLTDEEIIVGQITAARKLADIVIVSIHWGIEDEPAPNENQHVLAQKMVDAGVDVIIGTHPHVVQELKWVKRPDGGKTLVAYSLGNFISGMRYARNMLGIILTFDIEKTDGEPAVVTNVKANPVITHYDCGVKNVAVLPLGNYTRDKFMQHGCLKYDTSADYNNFFIIIKNTIPNDFIE